MAKIPMECSGRVDVLKSNVSTFDLLGFYLQPIRDVFSSILGLHQTVDNWIEALAFWLRVRPDITLRMRNGYEVWVGQRNDLLHARRVGLLRAQITSGEVAFDYRGTRLRFALQTPGSVIDTTGVLKETFVDQDFGWLPVSGKEVIDVGAHIGDTAIYFALKNAAHVYAFEPYLTLFEVAVKNVQTNGLGSKIDMVNAAITGRAGEIGIDTMKQATSSSKIGEAHVGTRVNAFSIEDAISRISCDDLILKMDCEGSEYDAILNCPPVTLRRFSHIAIEYHSGYRNLSKYLSESGFLVSNSRPRLLRVLPSDEVLRVGFLRAIRKER